MEVEDDGSGGGGGVVILVRQQIVGREPVACVARDTARGSVCASQPVGCPLGGVGGVSVLVVAVRADT